MSEEITAKSVALTLIENLRDLGVAHIFGVPSGGWVDFMEAIRNTDGIEFILTTHEGAAGFMADVCGRLSGVPGVCFGTFGPGATNLATGVGGANMDRSPLIALTDEMSKPMRKRVVQMGIDHQALFEPITKWTTRLDTLNAGCIIQDAAKVALEGIPGAVHIGMPVDVTALNALAPPTPVTGENALRYADKEIVEQAWQGIARAEKPAMVIGLGAVRAEIADEIVAFAEKHTMPVFLTPMAKGMISEDHRLYGGVLFHALSDQVAETHSQADLMIAIGYDPVEFNYENWLKDIPLLNVDVVPLDIDKKQFANTLQMEGDIKANLAFLAAGPVGETKWDIDALIARKEAMFKQMSPKSNEMGPCAVLDILRDVLPDEGIMTCDVGAHTHLIGQKWRTPKPGTQIMSNGWSSMGFGLPAAIAAKLTKPDVPVCCVVGDGGFLMTAGELATAVRYNLNIVVLVLTDNDLALIRIKQQRKDNPIYGTPVRETGGTIGGDNIFGVPVLKAHSESEVEEKLKQAFKTDGPVIVEAFVNSREYDKLVLRKDK
ncbi:MAG: thiamine pyrophosphate-binding protein [Rhizobiaceae bacterium]